MATVALDAYGPRLSVWLGELRQRMIAEEWKMSPRQRAGLTPRLKQVAEHIARRLREHRAPAVLIGGHALGVHGYVRSTQDLDLLTSCALETLHAASETLKSDGLRIEIRDPGPLGQDELDGVIDIRSGKVGLVQIVNMLSSVGRSSVETAAHVEGLPFPVVDLPHLIALKLKAYRNHDRSDVAELLVRNPEADRVHIRQICERFKVSKRFDKVVADMTAQPESEDA